MTVRADPAKAGQVRARFAARPHRRPERTTFALALGRLGRVPERIHLGKRRIARRLAALRQRASIAAKRRSNFALVARNAASGSTFRCRARLTTANIRSPISPAAAALSLASSAAAISSASSRILSQHRLRVVPVEADLAGLLLQLERAHQRRQTGRNAGEGARLVVRCRAAVARSAFSSALIRPTGL